MANIKKIQLSDGRIYSIFDQGALRLNENNVICTGNTVVDNAILNGHLTITEIDNVPLADSNEMVLTIGTNGIIKKQNIRQVLRDLGVITADVESDVLNLETVQL